MEQYISKSALVAEIERRIKSLNKDRDFNYLQIKELEALLSFLDTLETKEVQEPKDKERIREEIERLHEEYRGKKGEERLFNCPLFKGLMSIICVAD